MIEKVSQGRWPTLLLGETGTGKEVVARAIHARTQMANAGEPFVTIDCSSMVGPLMESELFGHTKGAFTGAAAAKIGLIELANGGTAFFDEIGELPLDLQAKLLRVLQEKEFRPVGSLATRFSDFRVIAATNRDLAKEVESGTFRRDLYFRLNVVSIRLAPLHERKEDIPALVTHFLARLDSNYSLTQETMDALLGYDWARQHPRTRELPAADGGGKHRSTAAPHGSALSTAEFPGPASYLFSGGKGWAKHTRLLGRLLGAGDKTETKTGPIGGPHYRGSAYDGHPTARARAARNLERTRVYEGRSCGRGAFARDWPYYSLSQAQRVSTR
jgi:hypothetical protein